MPLVIANVALRLLGAKRIESLTQNVERARIMNDAMPTVLKDEQRAHPWSFTIKRAEIAADATAPDFGRSYSYTLPSDYLALAPPYAEDEDNERDWLIEADRKILTDDGAPLEVRYVAYITDPNKMDACFIEACGARLAQDTCEAITQSNTKLVNLERHYQQWIARARKANAIERVPAKNPEDRWLSCRR